MNMNKVKNFVIIAVVLLYILSPIDIIPDFIPGIGYIDDIIAGIIGFNAFGNIKKSTED